MKIRPFAPVLGLVLALSGAVSGAIAGDKAVVVELFTSQGCSSCPPADALLNELSGRADVIPLALHVDYWDYIGWADEFADPRFTKRQKAYATAAGRHMVYTPQMIIDGVDSIVGAKGMKLGELIEQHRRIAAKADLDVTWRAGVAQIVVRPLAGTPRGKYAVHLVRFEPRRETKITRGENAGKSIVYSNIVTDWTVLGTWDGQGELALTAETPGNDRSVILVQDSAPGVILAAARAE